MLDSGAASPQPSVRIRVLNEDDAAVFDNVAEDVFDNPLEALWIAEFLRDQRHHMAVALHGDQVIGFASGVHCVHPDKPPELFINEVGVAPKYHRQGIGRQLTEALLTHARTLGCVGAWVLTERGNTAARGLYEATGGTQSADDIVLIEFDLEAERR